jgi:hypothetical protein
MLKRRFLVTAAFDAWESEKGNPLRVRKGARIFADPDIDGVRILFDIDGKNFEVDRELFDACTRLWSPQTNRLSAD